MKKLFVVFAAIALIGAFTVPAMSADWNFYGSVRMATFWDDFDNGDAGDAAGFDDDGDLTWDLQANSRIGAKVTSGDIAAVFEVGINDSTNENIQDDDFKTRLLYGTWEFADGCTLLIGQDYTPVYTNLSGQVHNADDGLNPYGMAYDGRQPQIKLLINNFELAFIEPETDYEVTFLEDPFYSAFGNPDTAFQAGALADTDTTLPKIAARYTFKTDAFAIRPYAGWQTVKAEYHAPGYEDDEDVDAYVVGLDAKFYFGPAWLAAAGYFSQNPGVYGLLQACNRMPAWTATGIEDNDSYGLAAAAGYKFNDMVSIEAGIGYVNSEVEIADGIDWEEETLTYYVNLPIKVADIFFIIPEIGFIDFGDTEIDGVPDIDNGDQWYAGAKWQINF